MRVVVDLTNSPHVPFFVPLVRRLRAQGAEVLVTARRFAQTLELAAMNDLDVVEVGQHGGSTRLGKARAAASRTRELRRVVREWNRGRAIDVALSHGSTDLPLVCRGLDLPHVTMFDYEWARTMHRMNCRLSWRVMTPQMIPAERLAQYGALSKLVQYPGLKEEYYLSDAELTPAADVRAEWGVGNAGSLVVLRPPPELALYHRGHHNELFDQVIQRLLAADLATTVVLARTSEQRAALSERYAAATADNRLHLPEHAVEALSLVAAADLMVSAGGTMNREAVALGTPVFTVFAGKMGGVDEHLIADGRLRQLNAASDIDDVLAARSTAVRSAPHLRDPQTLLDLALQGLPLTAAH